MSIAQAITNANAILPGIPVESGDDPRWQAISKVGDYIETNPEDVWRFVIRWGGHSQDDLRNAIACLLLEHLLEFHFDLIFPRVQEAINQNRLFADTFCRCWKFGQSQLPQNKTRFDQLQDWCRNTIAE